MNRPDLDLGPPLRVATPMSDPTLERRVDLDWLRITAFGLLILFHIGMFYVPWQWEVKSPRLIPALQIVLEWSAPWRLPLLFILSGAATCFMSRRLAPNRLFAARSRYLLPPLLFAVLIIVPPQTYFKVVEQYGYSDSYWRFWLRYLTFDRSFCRDGHCLLMPNWNHMWFIAYLWIYTALLLCILHVAPRIVPRLAALSHALVGWRLLVVPALVLATGRIALAHFFPETHGLLDDWYLHFVFFLCFLFGFVALPDGALTKDFDRLRWVALAAAIICYAIRATYTWHYRGQPIPIEVKVAMAFVYGFDQWSWIVAALGFAHRHLAHRSGVARQYLTEAVFPYYIIHQTAIVVMAHELAHWSLPLWCEVTLLVVATLGVCALTFELVRRVDWLRPLLGLKTKEPGVSLGFVRWRARVAEGSTASVAELVSKAQHH